MENEIINLAVIGLGRIGKIHANNINNNISGANLFAIADIYDDALKEVEINNIDLVTTDYHEVLKSPNVDGVLICTSTETHADIIIEASEKGKHIFCEKPIALQMEKIERALNAVEKSKVIFEIGFNRRYDPNFNKAQKLIEKGEIGKPVQIVIISRDPAPPDEQYIEGSGGMYLDMTIHDFDMARFLLGEEIVEIMATGNCLIDNNFAKHGDIDVSTVSFTSESGCVGTIINSRKSSYGYDNRAEVLGSEGSIEVENKKDSEVKIKKENGIINDKLMHFFTERYAQAYIEEIKDFTRCIKENKTPLASGYDGKVAVKLGQAAKKSLESQRKVKV